MKDLKDEADLRAAFRAVEGKRRHFASLEIECEDFEKFSQDANLLYRTWTVKKRRGKSRTINAPTKRLKLYQSLIKESLTESYSPSSSVYGVKANDSRKTCTKAHAMNHIDSDYLIVLDMKDFYPSIKTSRVRDLFLLKLNCSRDVADILSKLCCRNGELPQGAPTSPIIANMLCEELDAEFENTCEKPPFKNINASYQLKYTRYVDDMVISIPRHRPNQWPSVIAFDHTPLVSEICESFIHSVRSNGFNVNFRKLKVLHRRKRQVVNDITVNMTVNPSRHWLRSLRSQIFNMKKNPLCIAREVESVKGKVTYLEHIRGKKDGTCIKMREDVSELESLLKSSSREVEDLRDLYEELVEVYHSEHGFDDEYEVKEKGFREQKSDEAFCRFINNVGSIAGAKELLPYIFDAWPKLFGLEVDHKGNRITGTRPITVQTLRSTFPSMFLLGHKFWWKVIDRELKECLSATGNTYLDGFKLTVLTKGKVAKIVALSIATKASSLGCEGTFMRQLNEIADEYKISATHVYAVSLG